MSALYYKDEGKVSDNTLFGLGKHNKHIPRIGQIKKTRQGLDASIQAPMTDEGDGGLGCVLKTSDPPDRDPNARATVYSSVRDRLRALLVARKLANDLGRAQGPLPPVFNGDSMEQEEIEPEPQYLDVCIQGDGRNMGMHVKNVQFAMCILNLGRKMLRPEHRHCLAIMDGSEDYDILKYNLKDLIQEINDLEGSRIKDPLTGSVYIIRMFLSGDWKFLRTILGISSPNQMHFCLWCKCTKREIAIVDGVWTISRTLEEHKEHVCRVADVDDRYKPQEEKMLQMVLQRDQHKELFNKIYATTLASTLERWGFSRLGRKPVLVQRCLTASKQVIERKTFTQEQFVTELQLMVTTNFAAKRSTDAQGTHQGYQRDSLFPKIPFKRVVMDVLHCFLRVFDVLWALLVEDACRVGRACLDRLEFELQSNCKCGTFQFVYGDPEGDAIRREQSADIPKSNRVTWHELSGGDRLVVLRQITMANVFFPDGPVNAAHRQKLWLDFQSIYECMMEWEPKFTPAEYKLRCSDWFKTFLQRPEDSDVAAQEWTTGRSRNKTYGYYHEDCTPYIHGLVYHSHQFMQMYGRMVQFSCFALEQSNHTQQRMFHAATSHGGGSASCQEGDDQRTRKHRRTLATYQQIIAQHLRVTFNPCRDTKRYACSYCSKPYQILAKLRNHMRNVHGDLRLDDVIEEEILFQL